MLLPYGERYLVSEDGEVMNTETGRVLKPNLNSRYYSYEMYGKNIRIHRVMGALFLPKIDLPKLVIDHIDGNRLNNKASNLRWCNQSVNVRNRH